MEAAFNVLMVVLAMGFIAGIVFSIVRVKDGRPVMPDMNLSPDMHDQQQH